MPEKILLVEDEALIALAEARVLEKHGFSVVTAHKGHRAVTLVREDPEISLVLTDIDLGSGIDGTEAARQILGSRDLPVVFLTSHAEKEMVEKVKGISRYGYVLKNSGEFVLIEAINMAFELYGARKKIQERENRYRSLVNNSPFGISVIDEHMNFVAANPMITDVLDQGAESIVGRPLSDFFSGDEYAFRYDELQKTFDGGEARRFEVKRGGRIFYTTLIPSVTDDERTVQIVVQDITEQQRDREELRQHMEELSAVYEHTPVLMFLLDAKLAIRKTNARIEAYTSSSKEELMHKRVGEVFQCLNHLKDPRGCGFGPHCRHCTVRQTILDTLKNKKPNRQVEASIPRLLEGEENETAFLVSTFPLTLRGGPFVIVSIEDVTDRKKTEKRLVENAAKYRGLFTSIRDAILVADTDRKIIECNPAFTELFGYKPEEIQGKQTVTVYESEEEFRQMGEAIREHRGSLSDFLFTVRYRKKDGKVFPGETSVFYLRDENGTVTGFIGLIRDRTRRKRLEDDMKERIKNIESDQEYICGYVPDESQENNLFM